MALGGESSSAKNAEAGIRLLELVSCSGEVGAGREEGGESVVRERGSLSANIFLEMALVRFCMLFTFDLALALLATLLSFTYSAAPILGLLSYCMMSLFS